MICFSKAVEVLTSWLFQLTISLCLYKLVPTHTVGHCEAKHHCRLLLRSIRSLMFSTLIMKVAFVACTWELWSTCETFSQKLYWPMYYLYIPLASQKRNILNIYIVFDPVIYFVCLPYNLHCWVCDEQLSVSLFDSDDSEAELNELEDPLHI